MTKEVMSDVITPMNWSAFVHIIDSAMTIRYKKQGITYPKVYCVTLVSLMLNRTDIFMIFVRAGFIRM